MHASGAGALDGVLTIETSAGRFEVPLLANRTAPCLTASPSAIEFGAVEAGCHGRDQLISVTNTCAHPVRILSSAATEGFRLIASRGGVLAPTQSASFALSLAPASAGPAVGAFTLTGDVLDGVEEVQVSLVGDATPTVVIEDVIPLRREEHDVLFIIEDSPAMLAFSEAFRWSVNTFAHQLNYSEDIRIGVMTTSTAPGELGRLRRAPNLAPWLDNPSFTALEQHLALTGTSTARSSCLEALQAGFSTSSELSLMVRPHGRFEVICITSGADEFEGVPTPLFSSLLSSMPRWSTVTVVGHFSPTDDCGAALDTGVLRSFAEYFNGKREEVCEPQWWLGDVRIVEEGYRTNFFLSQRPSFVRAPLEVSVDGVPMPQGPTTWLYEAENNQVNFEPLSVPRPGQTLRLKYSPDCQ